MMVRRIVWAAAASALLLGLNGCVSTRSGLSSAADRLDHNANALARSARDVPAPDYAPAGYTRDTVQLADDAHEFRSVTLERDANDADVKAAFKRVSRSYLLVRDEVEHSDSREARADLKPVTDAYLDVEREIGGYPTRHASAYD